MQSHLFFGQQAVLSEKYNLSNNLKISFFFIQKSAQCCHISLGLLELQTPNINNIFFFLTEQYFIDALETILKLFQGF